jgi:NAD(P)-dependent dehydrogenase (short-subunit alcohol dehydrogenase family)
LDPMLSTNQEDALRQRVLITGASSGIGQACAVAFCADGAEVIGLDRSPGGATAAAAGSRFRGVLADLADPVQIESAFEQVDGLWQGRSPELFVACASISRSGHFLDAPVADIDAQLAINVRGMILCGQQVGRRMRAAGGGRIVHITSVAASTAWATEPVYCVTKGAQASLTQAMAIELAPFNIQVNAIAPGPLEVNSVSMVGTRADPEVLRHDLERTPMGRFGRAEDIVRAVRYLAQATWMTGQTIVVDGGLLATGLAYIGGLRQGLEAP